MRCAIHVGTLISHPCSLKATSRCAGCRRPACDGHLDLNDDGQLVCGECAGTYTPPRGVRAVTVEELFGFEAEDFEAFEGDDGDDAALAAAMGTHEHPFDS